MPSNPIPTPNADAATSLRSHLNAASYTGTSPLAQEAILRDLEDAATDDDDDELDSEEEAYGYPDYDLADAYRRPSVIATGPRSSVVPGLSLPETSYLSKRELKEAREQERSLLRDNHVIPPKHPRHMESEDNMMARLTKKLSVSSGLRKTKSHPDAEAGHAGIPEMLDGPTERSPLIGDLSKPYGGQDTPENIDKKWEEAVTAGRIHTTWQREAKVLARYSWSLILTFLLQYSLTMASVFTVGHIGKVELGAVSLAGMTANITGYAVYQGLATSLDTLCAQAYGSGKRHLVGLQMQRMLLFLWTITIPMAIVWASSTAILEAIVPEKETARLAGLYLKVLIAGAPGYAAFESGKRYVQAQGLFTANLYCLVICAPLNAVLNYLFVWVFDWGFIGAPIAVAITQNLLPLTLFLYVYFIDGRECWGGFSRKAFRNWGPMVRLALPGLVMVLAEFLAFEILTLSASWISTDHLAAQSVVSTVCAVTFQFPFPVSIAASTRIANLIGATLADAAKVAAKVDMVAACCIGIINVTLLSSLRAYIPQLFTDDKDVIDLVASLLPLCAAFQLFDALAANCNGILRGLGMQHVGGYVNLFAYYVVALPIGFGTGFGLHWGLHGLWFGPAIGLGLVAAIEGWFIYRTNWDSAVEAARQRNALG